MQAATYLPARKGGRHLKDENNMTYALNKRRDNKTYYVCTEKKRLNCPATAVVENMTEMIIKLSGVHVHDSNLMKYEVRQLEDEAIRAAAENHDIPRYVLGNITNRVGETTQGNDFKKREIYNYKCDNNSNEYINQFGSYSTKIV